MYCCGLWCNFRSYSHKSIIAAYNNVFRHLLNIKGRFSMSQLVLDNKVEDCNSQLFFSNRNRITKSSNVLIQNIYSSMYVSYSSNLYQY